MIMQLIHQKRLSSEEAAEIRKLLDDTQNNARRRMNDLFVFAAHNTVVALVLALFVCGLTHFWRNPPAAHVLWLLVLSGLWRRRSCASRCSRDVWPSCRTREAGKPPGVAN